MTVGYSSTVCQHRGPGAGRIRRRLYLVNLMRLSVAGVMIGGEYLGTPHELLDGWSYDGSKISFLHTTLAKLGG